MTTIHATPGNWVGFEHLFNALQCNTDTTYPPHNVVRVDDHHSIIELAVAGFAPDDLDIEWKPTTGELIIQGDRKEKDVDSGKTYTVKNIGGRSFTKKFRLSEHVVPKKPDYTNGILSIEVERVIPESERPVKLEIASPDPKFLQD